MSCRSIGPARRGSPFKNSEANRTPYDESIEVLDLEIERTLVRWRTRHGRPHHSLRTLDDWAAAWRQWGEILVEKCIEFLPGRRPAVAYAAGIIPARPLLQPIPQWWRSRGVEVHLGDGTSIVHYDLPEPYQRREALYLHDLGIVTDDELDRLRRRRPTDADYTFEIARFR